MTTDSPPIAEPVPARLRLAAAARLIGGKGPSQARAAKNLIESAPGHGIDLDLFFACRVGQTLGPVCLAVPGSGKTAVLFMSSPTSPDESEIETVRRAAAVRGAVEHLESSGRDLRLVQALPSPDEHWAITALENGGLMRIATLSYLRRARRPEDANGAPGSWPDGVSVEPVRRLSDPEGLNELKIALDRSYDQTLDCPELCGLRSTEDVIESHRAAGQFDPALWRVVKLHGEPVGCCLLNRNPELGSVELVYLGLAPETRGRGLGRMVLDDGFARAARLAPEPEMTCAVDQRNAPAVRMYERAGFEVFATKLAYIRTVGPSVAGLEGEGSSVRKV